MMLLTLIMTALTALSPWTSQPATVPDVPTQLEAPVNRSVTEPTGEPTGEPVNDPAPDPVPDPMPEPEPETEFPLDPANPIEAPVPTPARPRDGS